MSISYINLAGNDGDFDVNTGIVRNKILLGDGSETQPSLSYVSDSDSGIYKSGASFGFSIDGIRRGGINENGFVARDGTNIIPTYTFDGNLSSGLYYDNTNSRLHTTINGTSRLSVGSDALHIGAFGSAANPSISWAGDTDTGIFRSAANEMSFSSNGLVYATVRNQGIGLAWGTNTAPSLHFNSDTDSGLYRDNANIVGVAAAGVPSAKFTSSGIELRQNTNFSSPSLFFSNNNNCGFSSNGANVNTIIDNKREVIQDIAGVRVEPNTAGTPSFAWIGDAGTGLNADGAGLIGVYTSTVSRLFIGNNAITCRSTLVPSSDNTYGLGLSGQTFGRAHITAISCGRFSEAGSTTDRVILSNARMGFACNAEPTTTGSRNLGHQSFRWDFVYGVTSDFSSDQNIKENIKDVDFNCLDLIEKMNVKEFNYKESFAPNNRKKTYGLIAQDLLNMPELNPDIYNIISVPQDEEGYMGVNYIGLYALLIKAIKELSQKVKTLEDKLNNNLS